jgi:hypothetical protein
MTAPTTAERKAFDEIEPYVLMAASTLITCAYNRNYAAFDLLSRPHIFRATVNAGRVEFEVPEWLPIAESLLGVAETGLHSMVKHLHLQRAEGAGKPGMRIHRFQLDAAWCGNGETVSLTYSPWFRFAAPPYRFDIKNHAAAYVVAALGRLSQARGLTVRTELDTDVSVLWLSDRIRIEVMGDTVLTDITVLLDGDESHLSFTSPQVSVSRQMFPDVYAAARSANGAGEQFRGASLLVDEDRILLCGDEGVGDVQA